MNAVGQRHDYAKTGRATSDRRLPDCFLGTLKQKGQLGSPRVHLLSRRAAAERHLNPEDNSSETSELGKVGINPPAQMLVGDGHGKPPYAGALVRVAIRRHPLES